MVAGDAASRSRLAMGCPRPGRAECSYLVRAPRRTSGPRCSGLLGRHCPRAGRTRGGVRGYPQLATWWPNATLWRTEQESAARPMLSLVSGKCCENLCRDSGSGGKACVKGCSSASWVRGRPGRRVELPRWRVAPAAGPHGWTFVERPAAGRRPSAAILDRGAGVQRGRVPAGNFAITVRPAQ